jgi:Tfp pilus assembly protein PilZ
MKIALTFFLSLSLVLRHDKIVSLDLDDNRCLYAAIFYLIQFREVPIATQRPNNQYILTPFLLI